MKNLHLIFLALLALLVGCTKQFLTDDNALIITAFSTDFDTKANETAFEAGDKIGVFIENNAPNLRYETSDGSTWKGFGNLGEFHGGDNVIAYYPYSQNATNQNAIEVSSGVDFMITEPATITVTDNKASAALKFKHVLSKLVVSIKMPEEIAGVKTVSLDSVVVKNVFRKGVIDIATKKITQLTDKGDIKVSGNEIIVIPQTIQKIKLVFKMENGEFDSLAYNDPLTLTAGTKTTFTAISNADLYFTSFLDLKSGEAQTNLPLSFYVAPGRTWTLTSSEPWLSITPTTGTGAATVKVSVKTNSAYPLKPRAATITLKDDKPSFATPQKVMQNCTRIPTVEIAGIKWLMGNLTGTPGTTNVWIATNPQDYGAFFKWGDRWVYSLTDVGGDGLAGSPAGNASTNPSTSKTSDLGYDYGYGLSGGRASGDPCQSLGSNYKTPTRAQFKTLVANGSFLTRINGVNGRLFGAGSSPIAITTVPANCIFLPSAGYRYAHSGQLNGWNDYGDYWSSSAHTPTNGWWMGFANNNSMSTDRTEPRGNGQLVRCMAQ